MPSNTLVIIYIQIRKAMIGMGVRSHDFKLYFSLAVRIPKPAAENWGRIGRLSY